MLLEEMRLLGQRWSVYYAGNRGNSCCQRVSIYVQVPQAPFSQGECEEGQMIPAYAEEEHFCLGSLDAESTIMGNKLACLLFGERHYLYNTGK